VQADSWKRESPAHLFPASFYSLNARYAAKLSMRGLTMMTV
jgi:hypothetical protein